LEGNNNVTLPETGGIALQVTNVNVKLELSDIPTSVMVPFDMQRRHGDSDTAEYPTFGDEI
jgi:hypothetical protein